MSGKLQIQRWVPTAFMVLAALLLLLAVLPVHRTAAQATSPSPEPSLGEGDKPKPDAPNPDKPKGETPRPTNVGGDRPSPYPHVPSAFKDPAAAKEQETRIRAYLVDCSEDMAKKFTIKDKETTRLAELQSQVKVSLDLLRNNREVLFNLVSFGDVADLGGKAVPFSATVDGINQAKTWLDDRKAQGKADFFSALKEFYDSDVEEVRMLVGSLPIRPAGATEKELAKDAKPAAIQDFIVEAVTAWRKAGKKTTLDIIGIDLSADARAFYKRLAKAGGGQFLD